MNPYLFSPLLTNLPELSDTVINSSIWLHVEISIGILSGSLLVMRPIFSRAFPSQVLSRFSKSRTAGSHRLPDSHLPKPKVSSHHNGFDNGDIYSGSAHKKQKSWYNNVTVGSTIYDDEESGEGSEREIIPMGRIQVRRDVDLEESRPNIGEAK